jgi:hypothetical protein
MSEIEERFNVCQFFENGFYEYVRRGVTGEEAVQTAYVYTHNPAATILKIIKRVIITDMGDSIVFEWKQGEGVTFPPEAKGRK